MTAVGFVLILIGIGALLLFRELEVQARDRLEAVLADAFTAPVQIRRIDFSPWTRTLDLKGVVVSNPTGFKQGTAFESKRIRLDVAPKTLFSTPVVRQAVVEDADIYYRYEIGEGFNIEKLTERAESFNETTTGGFLLEEIRCEDAKVHFSTNLIPKAQVGMDLVNVTIRDINDHGPVTARKAAAIFFKSLALEIVTLKGAIPLAEIEPGS